MHEPEQGVGRVDVTVHEGVATLTMSNPSRRNAISPRMASEMRQHLIEFAEAKLRVLVLRGEGGVFSSGYSIDSFPQEGEALPVEDEITRLCETIERLPVVVVAAIEGFCIGAALDLACACDLRASVADARIGMPPAKLGIVYGWRGMNRLMRVAGRDTARYLIFSGDLVAADSRVGRTIVSTVHPTRSEMDADLLSFTSAVISNAPLAVAGAKRIFHALDAQASLDDAWDAEIHAMRERLMWSRDAREARAALEDRRAPQFTGEE